MKFSKVLYRWWKGGELIVVQLQYLKPWQLADALRKLALCHTRYDVLVRCVIKDIK